jgi:hypothetical protein
VNGSLELHTVAHELGHNLGLYHSNAWNCGSASIGSSCSGIEYGDTTDIMGYHFPGHYNAYQKERLGWLNSAKSPSIRTVQTSGVYFLEPYETNTLNDKALKILKSSSSTGGKTYYYVEYRQGIGFDQVLSQSSSVGNLTGGVIVHTGNDSNANSSYLLNMNPQQSSWNKAALNLNQTFQDSTAGVSLKLTSLSNAGAIMEVLINGTPIPTPTPTASPTGSPNPTATEGEISVMSPTAVYQEGQTVQIPIVFSGGDNSVSGLVYQYRITNPNGVSELGSGSFDSQGKDVLSFQVNSCAQKGTFSVEIVSQINGAEKKATGTFQLGT